MKIPTKEDEVWRLSRLIEKEFYDVRYMFEETEADFIQDQILESVKRIIDRDHEKTYE
jgi:DNA polymerase III sliding clamp (beta) subunit (PCNA family)